jgi:hypothetical protein
MSGSDPFRVPLKCARLRLAVSLAPHRQPHCIRSARGRQFYGHHWLGISQQLAGRRVISEFAASGEESGCWTEGLLSTDIGKRCATRARPILQIRGKAIPRWFDALISGR